MLKTCFRLAAAAAFAVAAISPAYGQATRTWVSGVGDDVNPCSRTAPCKTFAGAISKTAAGGEINCLDPGGFGTVTITKSITINCTNTMGSSLSTSVNGIVINDSATAFPNTIRVVLRGLVINGAQGGAQNASGNLGSGLVGINFISGASLVVEDVLIQNFNGGNAAGIRFTPASLATLTVINSTIINNGANGVGGGVVVRPGAAGNGRIMLSNVRIANNNNAGVLIDMTATTGGGILGSIDNSVISRNVNGVHGLHTAGNSGMTVAITNSVVANNSGTGILGDGPAATLRVGNTTVTGNATGISRLNTSTINSYGDNRVNGNSTTDGTFTSILPKI